jgi:hypothetical protein
MRTMLLFFAVLFASLAVGAWAVLSNEAALLLAWPALLLAVLSIPFDGQIILRPMFALVYRQWLWNDWYTRPDRVVRVAGWRTAVVETPARQRRVMTACFWGLE